LLDMWLAHHGVTIRLAHSRIPTALTAAT
jgi:hypothetical protein